MRTQVWSVADFIPALLDWVKEDANRSTLANAINEALKKYESVLHDRKYPLGEPTTELLESSVPSTALPSASQDDNSPLVVGTAALMKVVQLSANAARFTYAAVAGAVLSDKATELKRKHAVIDANNAVEVFLDLPIGGWKTENHFGGVVGAASLNTLIVNEVANRIRFPSIVENNFVVLDEAEMEGPGYPDVRPLFASHQAEDIYKLFLYEYHRFIASCET
ncbi:MAG: hypothetical protein ACD_70C00024G0002 [uncultured bacterium]|nr:MAG: hypothetical protein ACD_70C00024G0002 [uncultured bacterium]OGT25211.1 MAG: hypothetical protein A3B71_01700 [Gammaproteobacteria bacterium RIFCSPHIGHO2_02_FULL_42_43]OGT29179.1 MAG: hypothetical protein A2624_01980 [Gammaproteobacteria bacterium RIFCSPHIGHO2_01_FULL_42_8]OGT51164.1 MAG: hypothetical protein A3E54_02890 [Gammaproteobacteria bacterium RIFCSPHIGHO2_12_FULL_41_25]OGT62926.1 MAG: hypothetical protein A3I77_05135 [Gammaproteobacteria bacterium RIFCSPLOWO2_02_FULL_42_14]OGT